jgi:hypothetical protein
MNNLLTLCVLLLLPLQAAQRSQPADPWHALRFLVGDWTAEGSGDPGRGSGGFSFQFDLNGKILVRKNRADYPATKDREAFSHQDLMVIYPEGNSGDFRAIYFDNEGHVTPYAIKLRAEGHIEFVSNPVPGSPRFRLTYTKVSDGGLDVKFEIAPPDKPDSFSMYVQGTARRKENP